MIGKILQVFISSIPALAIFLKFYTMLGEAKHVVTFSEKKSILREIGNFGINLVQK